MHPLANTTERTPVGQTIVFCGLQVMSRGSAERGSRAILKNRPTTVGQTIDFCGLPGCAAAVELL